MQRKTKVCMPREDIGRMGTGTMLSGHQSAARADGTMAPRGRIELSVVCPFYNEAPLIAEAARRMVAQLNSQHRAWELVLVNDGSTDDGAERLLAALRQMNEPRVRVISYPVNYGRGRALATGIKAAGGDVIVTTEVDCSWGDDIVARLDETLRAHPECDFVVASPHCPGGGFVSVPAHRVFLSRWGNHLISAFFRAGLTMHTGMTRAYRRDVIVPLQTRENGKEFHLEVLFKLITLGFRFVEIPATLSWHMRNKRKGAARPRIFDARIANVIATHFVFLFLADPMKLFFFAAVSVFAAALLFIGLAVYNLLTGGVAIFFAMMGMFFLLFGFLFVGFSVLFTRLRDQAIEVWARDYPAWPPMRSPPREVTAEATVDRV
jgi:glycosyltransferase involved in cell wall biosynthesis